MNVLKAILLGIIQGLSEFLPISSSGHLVLAEEILNFKEGGLAFEVFVHFGTLLAVVWIFREDIWKMIKAIPHLFRFSIQHLTVEQREYILFNRFIILGSIPAAVIGILFESEIENLFNSHELVLVMLFITGLIMISSRYTREKRPEINGLHAFLIGVAQAFAIIPGISRSGSTIVTGLWLGIRRDRVARFSFILSTPVIFGATLLKLKDLLHEPPPGHEIINLILATLAATISGYLAIIWLLDVIKKQKLEWFGFYCIAISLIGAIFVMMN
ncbi:MAG: undecaprenyl-diphosphate phosphatase [Calditrichia bacterium]